MYKKLHYESYNDLYKIIGDEHHDNSTDIMHRHYFQIAGINVCVEYGVFPEPVQFKNELMAFATEGPGEDNITLRHHFFLPDLGGKDLGSEIYRKAPWAIYRKNGIWIYKGILPMIGKDALHQFALFTGDYSRAILFSPEILLAHICESGFQSLSLMPTDQIWLVPLLASRQALLLHSAAVVIKGRGFMFVGHSDAGKSTIIELLKEANDKRRLDLQILCDDRNIIRRWPAGWRVHGTWSHGDVADVSPADAPLKGVFFLEKAEENIIELINDRNLIWKNLLATLIRAVVTPEWWRKEIDLIERLINDAPFYSMRFDKTGAIIAELEKHTQ